MIVGVPKETYPGERRVALVPALLPALGKAGMQVLIEAGAGASAGYPDASYQEKGAKVTASRDELFRGSDILVQVRGHGANPVAGKADLARIRPQQIIVGSFDALGSAEPARELAACGATCFALELMPRITRAQSMDVLSSMATVAGYKAVLLAANHLPRMFPMLMTAAGTVMPARVFIIGAGVAGLQAISTARRLGGAVEAYDVRPAVREQVQSLGAKFVELPLEAADAEDRGGYAKAQDESFYRRQREVMGRVVAQSDVVITTALIPGRKSPVLVTADMVAGMAPGSVIVDLAAERGGNCELTRPDEETVAHGVTIFGPTNLPATVPFHASQMYSKNVATFLLLLVKGGEVKLNLEDEVLRDTMLTRGGEVTSPRVREALGLVEQGAGARREAR
jgi:proton-translocating NAD(P)+ transhydrogenase subunit alpha